MKEKIRVFEVRKTIIREETDKERIIFEYDDNLKEWVYVAPNAQKHTLRQINQIKERLENLDIETQTKKIS